MSGLLNNLLLLLALMAILKLVIWAIRIDKPDNSSKNKDKFFGYLSEDEYQKIHKDKVPW